MTKKELSYSKFSAITFLVFSLYVVEISLREYTWAGTLFVLITALLSVLTLYAISSRFIFSIASIAYVIALIDISDAVKFGMVRSHLTPNDLSIVTSFIYNLDFSIAILYWSHILAVIVANIIAIGLVVWIFRSEKRSLTRFPSIIYRTSLCLLFLATLITSIFIFDRSSYASAIRSQNMHAMLTSASRLRLSVVIIMAAEKVRLSQLMVGKQETLPKNDSVHDQANCENCPDIILLHLESVFDPVITRDYSKAKFFGEYLSTQNQKQFGIMEVNAYGGYSWITEFEILCGVNSKLYGMSGLYTHTTIAPYFKSCIPKHLKDIGYETTALYTSPKTFLNVGAAFSIYGIDRFIDSNELELPVLARNVSDEMMIDNLFKQMDQNSERPQFYFVSTNWNHSPHGKPYEKPLESGPYDRSKTDSPELADYVNRLNGSYNQIMRIVERMNSSKRPMVLAIYGDHHPYFKKQYRKDDALKLSRNDYSTLYALLQNSTQAKISESVSGNTNKTIASTSLFENLFKFSGMRLSAKLREISQLKKKCRRNGSDCPEGVAARLRTINMQ